jgi:hypothetical protein
VIKPPSLIGTYDLVFSGDPALDTPPEPTREPSESDAEWEKRAVAFYKGSVWVDWSERLRLARETGKAESWQALLKAGQVPTIFRMQQVPGAAWRKVIKLIEGMGTPEAAAICFRCAIVSVVNWGGGDLKVKQATDKDLRERIATEEIVNTLDNCHPGIVSELGNAVYVRMSSPSPLS